MAILVPGVGTVNIAWLPASDEDFKDKSEGGRSGYQPEAFVYHRAVANTLHGIDVTFAAGDADPATVGSPGRAVSAQFGIGDKGATGIPGISQYVDLSDTAYCNGDCSQTVYGAAFPSRFDQWFGHKGHNERTLSIEHDDNGGSADPAVKGIVTEAIIRTSIELTRLLRCGDIAKIRAAGIRVRDQATVDALAKIPVDATHLLMHNDIAGKGKPYCWKPWQADKVGFPRARYIADLTVPPATTPDPDPTPYSQADLDAAVKAATDPLHATITGLEGRIATIKGKTATFAADVADD